MFKIDTSEKYRTIRVEKDRFDANLTAEITTALQNADGMLQGNLIWDLREVEQMDEDSLSILEIIYESCYANGYSCCIVCGRSPVARILKKRNQDWNLVPTLSEAVELIGLEEMERLLQQSSPDTEPDDESEKLS
ncbi:MAG: STAS domain-containing protein [Thermoflavifilum sp.]|nr:STAS domain-containing protein [Thermoflavifilum sp.]